MSWSDRICCVSNTEQVGLSGLAVLPRDSDTERAGVIELAVLTGDSDIKRVRVIGLLCQQKTLT